MQNWQFLHAAKTLRRGGVIAYPTEAVWGLGCDPGNYRAVRRLLDIKQRSVNKGLILVASSINQLSSLLEALPEEKLKLLEKSWPGPTTWLIPDPLNLVPGWVKGKHSSVAVRVSAHLPVHSLCEKFGGVLVSTSANRGGEQPATSRLKLMKSMGLELDLIVNGKLGEQEKTSQIIDLQTLRVLR